LSSERRFFVKPEDIFDDTVVITGQDAAHIAAVLRLQTGDRVSVSDGQTMVYEVELTRVSRDEVRGHALSATERPGTNASLVVYQGLPKAKKMDLIVEKLTEIGADRIVPVAMSRSVAEYDGARGGKKVERWRTVAAEAAKQSRRVTLPEVAGIMTWKEAQADMVASGAIIVPWEEEKSKSISEAIDDLDKSPRERTSVALVIGPEGGITKEEISDLTKAGAVTVTLGDNILRTETAAIVATALAVTLMKDKAQKGLLPH